MNQTIDLKYLCTNLGNLIGLPVRLFEAGRQTFDYSIVALPIDPLSAYLDEVLAIEGHVGTYLAPHDYCFGVVNTGDVRLVLGPTRQIPVGEQELRDLAFELNVPAADVKDFLSAMKALRCMPLMAMAQLLSLINHVLNEGEELSLVDVTIGEHLQEAFRHTLAAESVQRAEQAEAEESVALHNTMDVENFIMDAVSRGDVSGLAAFFERVPAIGGGVIAQDQLRQTKNLLVVTSTLVSRAAIRGGMEADEALSMSDAYIRKCEMMTTAEAVTNLNYRLVMDYAERMEKLLYGHSASPLVVEVNNYVRHHLSEPITVEKLAGHLCRGRSRLSTDFKKETGEDLSRFIMRQKIDGAQKLLRYTDKPIVDIALYLGFSSQSHFARVFKAFVGLTPNEYRTCKKK